MRERTVWPVFLCAIAVGLLALACGGGEEATPTAAPRPTAAPQATATAQPRPTQAPAPTPTAAPRPTPTAATRPQPTPTPAPAGPTGRLRVAISSFSIENLDPTISDSGFMVAVGGAIYDWLAWHNRDGDLAPGLASSWEMSPDGKSWVYKLRSNMRFHNGDTFTADDVKFSLERTVRPEARSSQVSTWRGNPPQVEVVSADTVRVTTKSPSPFMPYAASARDGGEGAIVPKRYVEQTGAKAFDSPVGTGPFKFARHDGGVRYVFEAVTTPHPYRSAPKVKELEFLLAPEESTRVAMVRTGQADIVSIAAQSLDAVKKTNLQVLSIPYVIMGGSHNWGWGDPRIEGKPLGKREVRKALLLAINRQEMVDTLLGGQGEVPARWIATPGSLGYDPSWKPDPYDPAQAKKLLADAGYPAGFRMDIFAFAHPSAPWFPTAAQALAGYWSAIGITPRVIPIDYGVGQAMYRARPQPDELVGAVMLQLVPISSTNIVWFTNWQTSISVLRLFNSPELEALVKEAVAAIDRPKQIELVRKIVEWSHNEYVSLPLAITPDLYAATGNVSGWSPIRGGRGIGLFAEELRLR